MKTTWYTAYDLAHNKSALTTRISRFVLRGRIFVFRSSVPSFYLLTYSPERKSFRIALQVLLWENEKMSGLNGNAASVVLARLGSIRTHEADALERLRAVAEEYKSAVIFEADGELRTSIELLKCKAAELGSDDDQVIRDAIEAIRSIPPIGW